ncbi:TetR/AcrR family transcriptional regulator C-terminal domain-containing protein [Fusibacter bizertensis]
MKPNSKAIIVQSFKQLIQKKSIDKITVKELCEKCDINRQTFYNHFSDLFDIFKHLFKAELFAEIKENRTFETWCGGFLVTLQYLSRNSKMILHIYESSYRLEANSYFISLSNQLLENVIDECMKNQQVVLEIQDRQFIVNFYRHVMNGLMMDWVNNGMKEEPEMLLKKLQTMIDGSIPKAITAFAEEEKRHWTTPCGFRFDQ